MQVARMLSHVRNRESSHQQYLPCLMATKSQKSFLDPTTAICSTKKAVLIAESKKKVSEINKKKKIQQQKDQAFILLDIAIVLLCEATRLVSYCIFGLNREVNLSQRWTSRFQTVGQHVIRCTERIGLAHKKRMSSSCLLWNIQKDQRTLEKNKTHRQQPLNETYLEIEIKWQHDGNTRERAAGARMKSGGLGGKH